jgi:hypothetical protein
MPKMTNIMHEKKGEKGMEKKGTKIGKWVVIIIVIAAILSRCGGSDGKIKIPFGADDRIGSNYRETITELEEAGFTNIEKKMVATTLEERNEGISSITVDGENEFYEKESYEADVPIVIEYYEFQKQEEETAAEQEEEETFTPTIKVATGGEKGWPEFTIATNLPDKTVLILTLMDDNLYTEQKR